jgi:hypothetical protein
MSDCINGVLGKELEVRGLGPKDKRIRSQNSRPLFTNISAPTRQTSGTKRPVTIEHAILSHICPRKGYFSDPVPQILPRGTRRVGLRIALRLLASATNLNFLLGCWCLLLILGLTFPTRPHQRGHVSCLSAIGLYGGYASACCVTARLVAAQTFVLHEDSDPVIQLHES